MAKGNNVFELEGMKCPPYSEDARIMIREFVEQAINRDFEMVIIVGKKHTRLVGVLPLGDKRTLRGIIRRGHNLLFEKGGGK